MMMMNEILYIVYIAGNFKFGVHVDHSKSQPTNDKLSIKVGVVTLT